jgi:hypothetical protein
MYTDHPREERRLVIDQDLIYKVSFRFYSQLNDLKEEGT